jgi:hypothetical protein
MKSHFNFWILFFFFFVVLVFELRDSHLLDRHSTTCHIPSPFWFTFWDRVLHFCLGLASVVLCSWDYKCDPPQPACQLRWAGSHYPPPPPTPNLLSWWLALHFRILNNWVTAEYFHAWTSSELFKLQCS